MAEKVETHSHHDSGSSTSDLTHLGNSHGSEVSNDVGWRSVSFKESLEGGEGSWGGSSGEVESVGEGGKGSRSDCRVGLNGNHISSRIYSM